MIERYPIILSVTFAAFVTVGIFALKRVSIALGVILIVIGAAFFAWRLAVGWQRGRARGRNQRGSSSP